MRRTLTPSPDPLPAARALLIAGLVLGGAAGCAKQEAAGPGSTTAPTTTSMAGTSTTVAGAAAASGEPTTGAEGVKLLLDLARNKARHADDDWGVPAAWKAEYKDMKLVGSAIAANEESVSGFTLVYSKALDRVVLPFAVTVNDQCGGGAVVGKDDGGPPTDYVSVTLPAGAPCTGNAVLDAYEHKT